MTPSVLLHRIRSDWDIDAAGMLDGARTSDPVEQQALRGRALEQIAFEIGRVDAEREILPGRGEGVLDVETATRALLDLGDLVATSQHSATYPQVMAAYKQGAGGRIAQEFVRVNQYVEHLDGEVETQALRAQQDGENTEEALEQARESRRMVGPPGEAGEAFLSALARETRLAQAANDIARERLEGRAIEIAGDTGGMSPEAAIQAARLALIREAQERGDRTGRRAADRAAWGAASSSVVQARGREPAGHVERTSRATQRTR